MKHEDIADLYTLSPVQQGMLFHHLLSPERGEYFEQMRFTLDGPMDVLRFREAWSRVLARHPILRASYHWRDLDDPLQVIHREPVLDFGEHDWQDLAARDQQEGLERLVREDRNRGFDLSRLPLIRFQLIRLDRGVSHFLISFHHIILDGWSIDIALDECFQHYEALSGGPAPHASEPRPYRDYIGWLKQQSQGRARAFWRKELAGFEAPTDLGLPRPEHPEPVGVSRHVDVAMSREVSDRARSAARSHGLTLNTMILGGWALLTSRYSRDADVVFGLTGSGRPEELENVESMVGLFINTLPLRVRVPDDEQTASWLKELQARQLDLRRFQYSSLSQVQRWSDVPAGGALFESVVAFHNSPADVSTRTNFRPAGLQIRDGEGYSKTNYPLTLVVRIEAEISLRLLYDASRFDRDIAEMLLGHLRNLLESMAQDATRPVGAVSMLDLPERSPGVEEWNRTDDALPVETCVHTLFEEQVQRTPDAVAMAYEGLHVSYRDLNGRANALARRLSDRGVGPEVRVGIAVHRSVEMVVALLATLKAGGAAVALEMAMPRERLRFMIEDSEIPVLLSERSVADGLGELPCSICLLDEQAELVPLEEDPELPCRVDNVMYSIYTSGSTGPPKGADVTHRLFLNLMQWQLLRSSLQKKTRTIQYATFGFCVSFQEIFCTLCSGGTLIAVPEHRRRDIAHLPGFLDELLVDRLHLPLVALKQLAELVAENATEAPRTVREVVTAGEQLDLGPPLRQLFARMRGVPLHNHYGTSEIHVVTSHELRGSPEAWPAHVPIGRAISNVRSYVLDPVLRRVPQGAIGELHVGGAAVGRGYFHSPRKTAECYVPDAFGGVPGGRLYRTGDEVRRLRDGAIEFLGRTDFMVKIRGFRVEPYEIESSLLEHPSVREAVVVAQADETTGDRYLVAYLTARKGAIVETSRLAERLRETLPDHMIPSHFVVLERLPSTATGKIDRRALPAPARTAPPPSGGPAPAMDPVEKHLFEIWTAVLGVAPSGVDDDFFALGGNSLLALRIGLRVWKQFAVDLPLRTVFEHPSIAQFARAIRSAEAGEGGTRRTAVERLSRDEWRMPSKALD